MSPSVLVPRLRYIYRLSSNRPAVNRAQQNTISRLDKILNVGLTAYMFIRGYGFIYT